MQLSLFDKIEEKSPRCAGSNRRWGNCIQGGELESLSYVPRFPGIIGTFMGRDALSLAVSHLRLTVDDAVLLPLYTCPDILTLFKNNRIVLYDVLPDLTIDPDEVISRLKTSRVKMMIITNYFGYLQPYRKEIKDLCAREGICLIEDCAHSLLTEGSGETGHFAIYSFRKILPLPDGGGLRANSIGKSPSPRYFPRIYSDVLSVANTAKHLLGVNTKILSRGRIASHAQTLRLSPAKPKSSQRTLPLSEFAASGITNSSFERILKTRRAHFEFWLKVTGGDESLAPVFETLPPGVCPLGFPVRVRQRDALELQLRAAGIRLAVHWRVNAAVGQECGTSHQLARTMITLPVDPDLEPSAREVISGMLTHR